MKLYFQLLAAAIAVALIPAAPISASPAKATTSSANQKATLHRMDFMVEGASCVSCLRRVGQALRATKGVFKADVSIYRPFWAVVVYDAKETNLQKFEAAVADEKVKLVGIEDKEIDSVPMILIPKGLSPNTPPVKP